MQPIKTKFSVQNHWQKRNKSSHFDLRILAPSGMKLWSWALPKSRFPNFKERILAIKTSDHKITYMYFQGSLNNGDIVKLYDRGQCIIYKISDNTLVFKLSGTKVNGTFIFIRIYESKNSWVVIRVKEKSNESQTKSESVRRKH